MTEFTCIICGKIGHGTNNSQKYHKGKCAREANNNNAKQRYYAKAEEIKLNRTKTIAPPPMEKEVTFPVIIDDVLIGDDPPEDHIRARQAQAIDRILGEIGLNCNMIRDICRQKHLYVSMP